MNEEISLKKAERKVFSAATQDGLSDIFIGSIMLVFVIAPFLSQSMGDFCSSAVFVPFWGLIMLGIWLVRRRVVKSRIGAVEFGAARKARMRKFTLVMLTLNIIAFVLGFYIFIYHSLVSRFSEESFWGVLFISEKFAGRLTIVLLGLICLTLFSFAAYFLNFPRLYLYGLLTGLSPPIGEWLWVRGNASHHGFPITFGITAGIMILTGLFVFVRLIRNNPVPKEEVTTGET